MESQQRLPFGFTGYGGEYFRIWIVNIVLTVLTLGIYSAWAKVRRLQYFYRNSWVQSANFDYHANPLAILKGRVFAVVLFMAYNFSIKFSPLLGAAIGILIALVMPLLLLKSFRFRALNSSYCGLRFGFISTKRRAYKTFLLLPVLTGLTLYLLAPFTHQRIKFFQHNNSRYGQTPFQFSAGAGAFYKLYGITFLLYLIAIAVSGLIVGAGFKMASLNNAHALAISAFVAVLIVLSLLTIGPYFVSRLQNLVWNHTSLGGHRFESTLTARGLFWVQFTNFIAIICTLGLYKPFADIRLVRYRLQHMTMLAGGDLQTFVADVHQQVNATGEETAEIFDLDIAL
ncbi:MAG TPA: YjgN family protein [Methylophilaceae bacterium]|nr:YjgN family protein [Methylophilaceae bacterium]